MMLLPDDYYWFAFLYFFLKSFRMFHRGLVVRHKKQINQTNERSAKTSVSVNNASLLEL